MKASTWSIRKGWLMSCSCEPTIWRFLHSNHTSVHHQFSWSHIHWSAFHLAGGRLARRRTFKKEHLGRNNGGGHLSLQLWRHRVFAIAPSSCRSLHSPASIPEPTGIFVIWKKFKLCNVCGALLERYLLFGGLRWAHGFFCYPNDWTRSSENLLGNHRFPTLQTSFYANFTILHKPRM